MDRKHRTEASVMVKGRRTPLPNLAKVRMRKPIICLVPMQQRMGIRGNKKASEEISHL